jgi:RNA 3'-terminal phosphate cyclase-like protein
MSETGSVWPCLTDHHPGDAKANSTPGHRAKKSTPGFGLSLVAETTTGCLIGADVASAAAKAGAYTRPLFSST